jgi:hypothetical protein
MGIGDFLKDIGDGIATGIAGVYTAGQTVDKYIDPFYTPGKATKQFPNAPNTTGDPNAHANFAAPGLESTMAGMRWLYSNGVSQPISSAILEGGMTRHGGSYGDFFSAAKWGKAWHAAEHISPGQAIFLSDEDRQKAVDSPLLYYTPAASFLPAGWEKMAPEEQQNILKQAGMPAVGNAFVEQKRQGSDWFKYGTGAVDFASVMTLDPTILGGKALGALREAKVVMRRPEGGWASDSIAKMMDKSPVKKMIQAIYDNRDNPQLLNNTSMARNSAMGPRFGSIAATLQTPEEVSLFVRSGMGDVDAMAELRNANRMAAERMDADLSRLSALDLQHARYTNFPAHQKLVEMEMKRLSDNRAADGALINRYDQILQNGDMLDELNTSRWSMARAQQMTDAQNVYTIGAGRGGPRPVTITPGKPVLSKASYTPTPIDAGFVKSTLWGAGDFFSGPVTVVRMLKNATPNGYMRIGTLEKDSITELRGFLARIPGIKPETRASMLNKYMKTTTESERKDLLDDIGRIGAAKVAQKHGFSPEDGSAIYDEHMRNLAAERDGLQARAQDDKVFSAAQRSPEEVAAGQPLHIDHFTTGGNKVSIEPFTVTRLINDHIFQDLDAMDKVFRRHGDGLQALRRSAGNAEDWVKTAADNLQYMWKFGTLFRLGYIPRVMGDDLSGQWARLGSVAMAGRIGYGIKNGVTNASRRLARPAIEAQQQIGLQKLEYISTEKGLIEPLLKDLRVQVPARRVSNARDLTKAQARVAKIQDRIANLPAGTRPVTRAAHDQMLRNRTLQLRQAERRVTVGAAGKNMKLQDLELQWHHLNTHEALVKKELEGYEAQSKKVIQGSEPVTVNGQTFEPAFGGRMADYHMAQVSADQSVGNIFNASKQMIQGNLERSFSHGARPISVAQDEAAHAQAWAHAINHQMMQDPLQSQMVAGMDVQAAIDWMTKDAKGIAYRKRLPKMITTEDIARSMQHEIDQYMPFQEIRDKALEGEVTPDFLKKAVPQLVARPDVHIGNIGLTQLNHMNTLDRVVQRWYDFAATLPANRMSRHPLYNQLYEGHLKKIVATRENQGAWELPNRTVEEVTHITDAARQLALRDTRKLVFDIAHRSDAAAALRFISPFFSATAEAFQRWGRIIADKPEVAGYAATFFNAPLALGAMQDGNGNHILPNGKALDPVTGKWRIVPKSERWIVTRVPKWVADSPLGVAFNITKAGGTLALSQNSMNMVTQGDPWFNPGVGPIVTIPANMFVADKPKDAEVLRHLGVLPVGQATGNTYEKLASQVLPATLRNFVTGLNTSDSRYQSIKMQIMQQAIFDHANNHVPMPSAKEIADRTRNYWFFQAASSFLQPMATQRKDPFQFYRDQYNNLRGKDPMTADDKFLQRYGESYFIFAAEITKNNGGINPTQSAAALQKQYAGLLAANPELGALIIGPDGKGPFSPDAYQYELNNPLVPGGSEMMRSRMSADQALAENQRRLGWAKFIKRMNSVTADLHKAGFQSFDDPGAESFKADKKAWVSLYAEPLYPDGTPNPYYNAEWSKDWFAQDARKYERRIPALLRVARSSLANNPARTDLKKLQEYLGARQQLVSMLNDRKQAGGSGTLTAQANADLQTQWVGYVDSLIEKDTKFGDLYHRYLARDLGVDAAPETTQGVV